ncbi:hypothetical protein PMNALOAF_0040 [Methylobacterium adhaesivum]|nr:hypothetical protein PMNALOAF_0040 [Methylobacterium adhaesivum]
MIARECDSAYAKPFARPGFVIAITAEYRPPLKLNEGFSMKTLLLVGAALFAAAPAVAQVGAPSQPGSTGTVVQQESNTTGNDANVSVSRGPTGADTATTDSAAGGNASRPEQAVPNGSANGGGR